VYKCTVWTVFLLGCKVAVYYGLGWVGSVRWWVGSGRVTHNSGITPIPSQFTSRPTYPRIISLSDGVGYLTRRSDSCSRWLLALMPRGLGDADDSLAGWTEGRGWTMQLWPQPCRLQRMNVSFLLVDAPLSAQSHLHRRSDRQQTSFVDYIANFGQFHTKKLRVLRPKPANCHKTVRSDGIPTQ